MITYLIIPRQESRIDIDVFIDEIVDNIMENDVTIVDDGQHDESHLAELDEVELRNVIREVFDRWVGH